MTDELVNRVVQQVLAALGQQGAAAPLATAPVRPALAGPPARLRPGGAAPAARKVFLTAEMLQRRLAAEPGDGRTIELAWNESLTPAAADVVDERHLTVRKQAEVLPAGPAPGSACAAPGDGACAGPANLASPPGPARPAAPAALGLVVERPNETARGVLASLGHDGLSIVDYSQTDCWVVNTRLLCQAVAAGTVPAGVVLVPFAADAMLLAGKMPGIRPVQGSGPESVAAAMRHFAANVLVLEHAVSTYHQMRTMIRTFATPRTAQPSARVLMETIRKLDKQPTGQA